MDYGKMTAPCGIACFECIVYKANDNENLKKMISEKIGIPAEKVGCEGCRSVEGICPVLPGNKVCNAYECSSEKGKQFCYQCDEFPCDNLHPYADKASSVPHNTKIFNLCLIKKMGLENWGANKAKSVSDTYFNGELKLTK